VLLDMSELARQRPHDLQAFFSPVSAYDSIGVARAGETCALNRRRADALLGALPWSSRG
jgi:hypothetical protein